MLPWLKNLFNPSSYKGEEMMIQEVRKSIKFEYYCSQFRCRSHSLHLNDVLNHPECLIWNHKTGTMTSKIL